MACSRRCHQKLFGLSKGAMRMACGRRVLQFELRELLSLGERRYIASEVIASWLAFKCRIAEEGGKSVVTRSDGLGVHKSIRRRFPLIRCLCRDIQQINRPYLPGG